MYSPSDEPTSYFFLNPATLQTLNQLRSTLTSSWPEDIPPHLSIQPLASRDPLPRRLNRFLCTNRIYFTPEPWHLPRSPSHIRSDDVPSMDRLTTERDICQAFLPIWIDAPSILFTNLSTPRCPVGSSLSTANKSCSTSGVPALIVHHHATLTNLGTHRNHPQTLRSHPKSLAASGEERPGSS